MFLILIQHNLFVGGGLFEGGGLFDDAPMGEVPSLNEPSELVG